MLFLIKGLDVAGKVIADLELRLSASRTDISSLAEEILAAAHAKVPVIQLRDEWTKSGLSCRNQRTNLRDIDAL